MIHTRFLLFKKGYQTNIEQFLHFILPHKPTIHKAEKVKKIADIFKLKLLKVYYKLSYNILP